MPTVRLQYILHHIFKHTVAFEHPFVALIICQGPVPFLEFVFVHHLRVFVNTFQRAKRCAVAFLIYANRIILINLHMLGFRISLIVQSFISLRRPFASRSPSAAMIFVCKHVHTVPVLSI